MIRPQYIVLAVTAALALTGSSLHAQDSGPLIDKLVQKGILNDQEAEELRADLVKDFQSSSAGKLNMSNSVMEMKLYGDGRLRYQYDDQQSQAAEPAHVSQRSRFRYRLRLNADFRLTDNFFGGVQLETGQASDSANETVQPGYTDSSIFINRVFLGVNIGDWATVIAGKQKNPFYTTDMVWDPDISPYGVTESISIDKLFTGRSAPAGETASGYGKDGKSVVSYTSTGGREGSDWGGLKLTFVAGQFVYDTNNDESAFDNDASSDVFHFVGQLIATYEFNSKTSVTVAPGFMFYNAGDVTGAINETPYAGASGFIDNNGDSVADFTQDSDGNITVLTSSISGESRDLAIITAPGEFKFPIGSLNGRFYWDVAFNTAGKKRYDDVYGFGLKLPVSNGAGVPVGTTEQRHYTDQDALAWLAGLEIGAGKGKGAWTLFVNYRETGIAAIDPNLNDSDFALGKLNTRGFKFGTTYGVTDSVSLALTGFVTYNLDDKLQDQNGLANRNAVNTMQFDVNFKF